MTICPTCCKNTMSHRPDGSCQPLIERMRQADWYWHYSDDNGVRSRGQAETERIRKEMTDLAATNPLLAAQYWKDYGPDG